MLYYQKDPLAKGGVPLKYKCLPQEVLKLIACITMLLDHIGATLFPYTLWLRVVGRLAFPIYAFLLYQGFRHTRSASKYLLRLGISMLLSELPFDILFFGKFTWEHQSVMVTLLLSLMMVVSMDQIKFPALKLLPIVPFALLAELACTDYGGLGVLTVALFALTDGIPYEKPVQLLGLLLLNYAFDSFSIYIFGLPIPIQLFAALAMIPIALYSERKLTHSRVLQWLFYAFYPAHLTALIVFILLFLLIY
jgi:hypothetical protein